MHLDNQILDKSIKDPQSILYFLRLCWYRYKEPLEDWHKKFSVLGDDYLRNACSSWPNLLGQDKKAFTTEMTVEFFQAPSQLKSVTSSSTKGERPVTS